jgi:hypothetical protein
VLEGLNYHYFAAGRWEYGQFLGFRLVNVEHSRLEECFLIILFFRGALGGAVLAACLYEYLTLLLLRYLMVLVSSSRSGSGFIL